MKETHQSMGEKRYLPSDAGDDDYVVDEESEEREEDLNKYEETYDVTKGDLRK